MAIVVNQQIALPNAYGTTGTSATTLTMLTNAYQWTATTNTTVYWYTGQTPALQALGQPPYIVPGTYAYMGVPAAEPTQADRDLWARRHARTEIERRRAHRRGRKLLLSMLTLQQMQEYAKYGAFTVVGSKGGIFRMRKRGRVQELDLHGQVVALHCIHTSWGFIEEDNLIAMKLLAESDEVEFREIAVRSNTQPHDPIEELAA